MNRRRRAEAAGRDAEALAADWLRARGWTIRAERARIRAGEVDLIAEKDGLVAFVEVKQRADRAALDQAIDHRRLRRVAAAADILYASYCADGQDARIDVILIAAGEEPRHLTNVWHG